MADSSSSSNRWALLVGVNFYMTGNARKDDSGRVVHYHSLGGCVNDVALLECFLKDEMGVPDNHIFKLTSSAPDDPTQNAPREDRSIWPTYRNISRAFLDVLQKAQPGNLVYIHYSGHGARVKTAYGNLKGSDGIDEVLVPIDIEVQQDSEQSRYVRDIEIASWLQEFVSKGLRVTVVLDSCYAGSSNRTYESAVRGTGAVDYSLLSTDSIPTSTSRIPFPTSNTSRTGKVKKNWLLEASGYTFLAASTAFQKAYERRFADKKHGVLTYYLVDALRCEPTSIRPSLLLGRILAKIQSHYSDQTPIIDGEDSEAFFGLQGQQRTFSVRVLAVHVAKGLVELDHGALHGVQKGAEYAICSDDGVIVAKALVTESMGLTSVATFLSVSETDQKVVLPGFQALLLKQAPEQQVGVRLLSRDVASDDDNIHQSWLRAFRDYLDRERTPLHWKLLSDTDPPESVDFFVTVADGGSCELLDSSLRRVAHLPTLPSDDPTSAARLSGYISHMAKFRLVQRLRADPNSALKAPCRFEVLGKATQVPLPPVLGDLSRELVFPSGLLPAVVEDGEYKVHEREVVSLLFENQGTVPIYVTLFDLKPRWGVEKIYPEGGGWSECVGPGEKRNLPILMEIPESLLNEGVYEITETFKAVVTLRSTPLGVLQLPDIGKDHSRSSDTDGFTTGLDQLTQAFALEDRDVKLKGRSSGSWQTYDIMIRTVSNRLDSSNDYKA